MRILICSDIHGDIECARAMLDAFDKERADKLLILGDLLYHGPRNDLPPAYAPKAVIELLNANRDKIITVRGNCDTEVDQMVLTFPILQDFSYLFCDGLSIVATHGHNHGADNPPPLCDGDILLCGHTHVFAIREIASGNYYINPGSVTLPKEGKPRTYAVYVDRRFDIKDFDGNILLSKQF